jgi:hypothetical protein
MFHKGGGMTYLRSLFLNFLIVFFVDREIPGIVIQSSNGSPDVVDDLLFSSVMALLNASIFPALFILGVKPTIVKIAILAFIFSFGGFYVLMHIDIGINVYSYSSVFLGGLIVFGMSIFTNIMEKNHHISD